jgi:vitamin-K-epoxide reductase (warfarin-sensitive)
MPVAMTAAAGRVFVGIAALAVVGVVVSSVSLYHHFGSSKTTYCDFGENFNCDIVNRSTYSTVLGVPDALIGILGYTALLGLAAFYRNNRDAAALLLLSSIAGLAFALYLTYIEAFVLATWCILCLSSLSVIFLITLLSSWLAIRVRRE